MLTFTISEIFASVLHAAIYGCLFALCISGFLLIKRIIEGAKDGIINIIRFEKILPLPRFLEIKTDVDLGAIMSSVFIVLFAIGFSLLSHFSLDGEIRLYMLIIAFASFYLSKIAFLGIFEKILLSIFRLIFTAFSFVLRIIILPIRAIVRILNKIFCKYKTVKIKK